jgi:hypothetical protein
MYKVPMSVLQDMVNALEKSNDLLKGLVGTQRSAEIYEAIAENERQIEFIKTKYYLNG